MDRCRLNRSCNRDSTMSNPILVSCLSEETTDQIYTRSKLPSHSSTSALKTQWQGNVIKISVERPLLWKTRNYINSITLIQKASLMTWTAFPVTIQPFRSYVEVKSIVSRKNWEMKMVRVFLCLLNKSVVRLEMEARLNKQPVLTIPLRDINVSQTILLIFYLTALSFLTYK